MGLIDRITARRVESPSSPPVLSPPGEDPVFGTKALRKFLSCLTVSESPVLLDLGPVVGANVSFFGEQLGCKIIVEDVFADLERHIGAGRTEGFPAFLKARFTGSSATVHGILCWDLFDYLDRTSAQALADELTRVLRPEGALLGFFGLGQARDLRYTKYIVVDAANLRHRRYPAARGRQVALANRDIIRLFPTLRVSDSFLLQNNLREILFRKPAWESQT